MHLIKTFMILGLFYSTFSFAETVSGNFKATSTLTSSCTISSTNGNFGAVDYNLPFNSLGISQNTIANVTVRCTNQTPYTVSGKPMTVEGSSVSYIMNGTSPGNTDKLYYNIWLNPDNTGWFADGERYTWGGGNSSLSTKITATGNGTNQAHNLYLGLYTRNRGRATPDSYVDNFTLNLSY